MLYISSSVESILREFAKDLLLSPGEVFDFVPLCLINGLETYCTVFEAYIEYKEPPTPSCHLRQWIWIGGLYKGRIVFELLLPGKGARVESFPSSRIKIWQPCVHCSRKLAGLDSSQWNEAMEISPFHELSMKYLFHILFNCVQNLCQFTEWEREGGLKNLFPPVQCTFQFAGSQEFGGSNQLGCIFDSKELHIN